MKLQEAGTQQGQQHSEDLPQLEYSRVNHAVSCLYCMWPLSSQEQHKNVDSRMPAGAEFMLTHATAKQSGSF
jgi:hypothetical protein